MSKEEHKREIQGYQMREQRLIHEVAALQDVILKHPSSESYERMVSYILENHGADVLVDLITGRANR